MTQTTVCPKCNGEKSVAIESWDITADDIRVDVVDCPECVDWQDEMSDEEWNEINDL